MKLLRAAIAVLLASTALSDANPWSIASPDGHCVITVSLNRKGELAFEVARRGMPVILESPLGIRRNDETFEGGLVLKDAGRTTSRREAYELFAGVTPRVDHTLNCRSLVFVNTNNAALVVDLVAGNEGVAFRYRFPGKSSRPHTIQKELTGFTFPAAARGWLQPYHGASEYTPAYEDFYFNVSPGERPPDSRAKALGWAFPALFHVAHAATWVLLTESGTDESYCGCHLAAESPGGSYRIAFPSADETTKGWTNRLGPEPQHTLPWTLPWRVMVLGETAGHIATATLVTDLAAPSRIADTSWIKPGRASWAWWAYPDGPNTARLFDDFTDFATRMGWEYTLFDAGWWKPGLKRISAYAQSKGVAPLAWTHAADFYEPGKRRKKLEEMRAAGIRGVKVDFWCSDRQETLAAIQDLLREAAERRLVVNLHGCTVPRGWQRTWPNLLTMEAVLGSECYFFESRYPEKAAQLNTILPFTRNAIGPMDSTPVACSPKKYARTTTAAHELATALVFTSGLIHYADKPEFFESLPKEARQVLRDAPARWDETRCLAGEPGRLAVFARRSGPHWFVAGINGTGEPLRVALDLAPFNQYRRRLVVAEERDSPLMRVAVAPVPYSRRWQHEFPPRGGFILRLDR